VTEWRNRMSTENASRKMMKTVLTLQLELIYNMDKARVHLSVRHTGTCIVDKDVYNYV
jgi:hypothetical protein